MDFGRLEGLDGAESKLGFECGGPFGGARRVCRGATPWAPRFSEQFGYPIL